MRERRSKNKEANSRVGEQRRFLDRDAGHLANRQERPAATREDPRFFELATEVREALHMGGGHDFPLAATGLSEGAA